MTDATTMWQDLTDDTSRTWLDLTLAQQAVWLDAKLGGSTAYQLGGWLRSEAPVAESTLRQSLVFVMARHDALRLRVDDELPRQWLDESADVPLEVIDVDGADDPEAHFLRHVERAFARGFQLGDQALFQVDMMRFAAGPTYLLWRFHHLIVDSISVGLTLQHWFSAYQAMAGGAPRDLAPPSSYVQTIASDASYLASAHYQRDLAYWTARFDPIPEPLIAVHGAVSGPVVEAMAQGVQARLGSECAVAVSGIAGPAGGSPRKPVGTVWLAWAGPGSGQLHSLGLWFPGDRAAVRAGAVWVGLTGLLAMASQRTFSGHGGSPGVA